MTEVPIKKDLMKTTRKNSKKSVYMILLLDYWQNKDVARQEH